MSDTVTAADASGAPAAGAAEAPLLRVRDVVQEFHLPGRGTVHACSGVSLDVREGEALGVVGESGSGKSTLVRSILQAPGPSRVRCSSRART